MPVKKDNTFTKKMPESLTKLRNDKAFCDVILRSGLREVYAHRIILAMLSDYFTLLFKYEGGFDKPAIVLDENMISGDCLGNIVSYAYTGEIYICEENVYDLLLAADYFDIQFIKTQCVSFLNELQIETEMVNLDGLPYLIWVVCHFNLTKFLEPICRFVSKHFADISENILLILSPHCLLTLLKENNLSVLYNDVPADDVECELFNLVVSYINRHDLPDQSITELIQIIQLSEITSDDFSSILESSPRIRNNEVIIRVSNLRALPLFVEGGDTVSANSGNRQFSRGWKYVDGLEMDQDASTSIELDDRIHKIKIYNFTGFPSSSTWTKSHFFDERYSVWHEDHENYSSVKGLSLIYKSGEQVTIGDTSEVPIFPLDQICSQELTLGENEVIVKLSIKKTNGMLQTIKFVTNLGNVMGSTEDEDEVDSYYNTYRQTFSPKGKCGYFHSFGKDSTIDSLTFLWVQYDDPILRQYVKVHQERLRMQLTKALFKSNCVRVPDYDDDFDYY